MRHEDAPCECGNETYTDGFYPCFPDGTEVEPTIDSGWSGHYICLRCGKVETLILNDPLVGTPHAGPAIKVLPPPWLLVK